MMLTEVPDETPLRELVERRIEEAPVERERALAALLSTLLGFRRGIRLS